MQNRRSRTLVAGLRGTEEAINRAEKVILPQFAVPHAVLQRPEELGPERALIDHCEETVYLADLVPRGPYNLERGLWILRLQPVKPLVNPGEQIGTGGRH